jgi:hypothetical protein
MNVTVQNADFAEIAKVVARQGDEGIKISEVVNALTRDQKMPPSRARYVVRSALDKGKVRTDRNFRLHLTTTE